MGPPEQRAPAQPGPRPGRAGPWGAGDRPCRTMAGAGAGGPGGAEVGPWARRDEARQGL